VEGRENLQDCPDPAIFAFNHNSSFETILVPTALIYLRDGRRLGFVVDWMFGRLPLVGWVIRQTDPIYVYNKPSTLPFLNQIRAGQTRGNVTDACIKRLEEGASIGIFPEGTRNPDPCRLLRGRSGIGHIALRAGVPVVPIGIDFPARLRLGRNPHLGKIVLRIGRPLHFITENTVFNQISGDPTLSEQSLKQLSLYMDRRITHRVMEELAILSGKSYPFTAPVLPPEANLSAAFNLYNS
jgi:1-acyl-sn-glycerol-3-phosphate acyltransferase